MSIRPIPVPQPPALLSEDYRRLNAELHGREPSYGTTGRLYLDQVRRLALRHGVRNILDYGCGKQDLWRALKDEFDVRNYDPAIPGLGSLPEPADLVACIDVLEHVEPDFLENVLTHIALLATKVAFFTIATRPSGKLLSDGTNPHRIVESAPWWLHNIERHFRVAKSTGSSTGTGLQVVVEPRDGTIAS